MLLVASLALANGALAAPAATLKVVPRPIPGFAGTGDILGAGAAIEVQVTVSGTEHGGLPSPLKAFTIYMPTGVKLAPAAFPTCPRELLAATGRVGCPTLSRAGPPGEGLGVFSIGGQTVPERLSIEAFFVPAGNLGFYFAGRTPIPFQIIEKGYWTTASAPFGQKLVTELPPMVSGVYGTASIVSFKVRIGAAYRRGEQTASYITLPKTCPRGGAAVKASLTFFSGATTTVSYRVPCPKRR